MTVLETLEQYGKALDASELAQLLGVAEWDKLPAIGQIGLFQSQDGRSHSVRSIDKIEDGGPEGETVVHLGGARPSFVYRT